MRVIGYTRVSTEEQALSGLGLEAQEQIIRAECALERRGWQLVELIADEGESGKTLERPGLQRALHLIATGKADVLLVTKLDRLSRSVIDFSVLLEWFTHEVEARLVALDVDVDTSTAAGLMMARILSVVAEWERDVIAERTRSSLAALRARGKPTGRPAVADHPELAGRIRLLRTKGMTYQAIADKLNAEGVPTIRGGAQWRVSSVQSAAGYRRRPSRRRPAALPDRRAA
jgi:DNA invertase Pin-like site-specific DNA recombinase